MKFFDFSHWDLSDSMHGLLFFSQALEEMLFHYGHDSLKVPALNFRFLCVEIKNTIIKIEDGIVDKGNMTPLFEELKECFENDCIAQDIFGSEFDSLFFAKNAEGEIIRNISDLFKDPSSEKSIKRIREAIDYFIDEMGRNDRYYEMLKNILTNTIKSASFGIDEQELLYKMTRILLADLINYSYSQEYIFWVVNDVFYNKNRKMDSVDVALELFWSYFDFKNREYIVILPLKNSSLRKHLEHFNGISVKVNERGYFDNSCNWIIEVQVNAKDQHKAQKRATEVVSFFSSLLQYNNHKSKLYNADRAVVILKDDGEYNVREYMLKAPITPLKRGNTLPDEKNNEKIAEMVSNFSFFSAKLTNVIELHSSAINSNEVGNQLLNLWTIVEVLVPTERKNSFSKINQLCNTVTTVLNSQYILSLVSQLIFDLNNCIPEIMQSEFSKIEIGENNIEKMVALLILSEYQTEKNTIIAGLACYPLLEYRIEKYSFIFSDRIKIKTFLTAHRKRISWHIMRIYRNRNMIVHDGSYFPYINIITQNLHHYVDTLIDTINLYASKGYSTINTVFTALQQKEYRHIALLEEKGTNGQVKAIGADFVDVVLGYLDN